MIICICDGEGNIRSGFPQTFKTLDIMKYGFGISSVMVCKLKLCYLQNDKNSNVREHVR